MRLAVVLLAIAATGAASAQAPAKPPAQSKPFVFEMPKSPDALPELSPREPILEFNVGPKKAPPGTLCLLQSTPSDRCSQTAELIRKPYQAGDGDLYLLDQQAGKTRTEMVAPLPPPLPNGKPLEGKAKPPG